MAATTTTFRPETSATNGRIDPTARRTAAPRDKAAVRYVAIANSVDPNSAL